jgi:exodeoxyribonuclease VII small subunit
MARAKGKGAAPAPPKESPGESTGGSSGEEPSFEARLERIEQIVDRLDQGELALEESLSVFEEGVALSKQCWSDLEGAERRVETLVREGGAWLARPFDAPEDDTFEDAEED